MAPPMAPCPFRMYGPPPIRKWIFAQLWTQPGFPAGDIKAFFDFLAPVPPTTDYPEHGAKSIERAFLRCGCRYGVQPPAAM